MQIVLSNQTSVKVQALEDIATLEQHAEIEEEHILAEFLRKWMSDLQTFTFHTSGSTGTPKPIQLERDTLVYSAKTTLDTLAIRRSIPSLLFLLCISPKFIGGAMVIVRAWLADAILHILKPSTEFNSLAYSYDLASIVPLQAEKLIKNPPVLAKLKNVLIGGAPLSSSLEGQLANQLHHDHHWYATYGMTETASHVALRKLGTDHFVATGDVVFSQDERGCLQICGTATNHKTLITNDLIELISPNAFQWRGRYDFIINTGGFKVNPERIEHILSKYFTDGELSITWVPDHRLGQKVVGLSTTPLDHNHIPTDALHAYELPKAFISVTQLPKTPNGKIDRKACHQLALEQLNLK